MDRQEFLHKLAHDELSFEQTLSGFAKYYLCAGQSTRTLCRDICIEVSATAAREAGEKLMRVFRILAGEEDDHG